MTASPRTRPRDVYRPFTAGETDLLRRFSATVRLLQSKSFFQQIPRSAELFSFDEHGASSAMEEPDDDAVRGAISVFRQLYLKGDDTQTRAILNLLKRAAHDHGGPDSETAISELRDLGRLLTDIERQGIGIGIVFEGPEGSREVDPEAVLDSYFHGLFMHQGEGKREVARALDGLGVVGRFTLYHVMYDLTRAYGVVANGVDLILAEPALLDACSGPFDGETSAG